jgi:hypothetical protein
MQIVDLPLMHTAATPQQALNAMRAAQRSAVVLDHDGTTSLVMGGAIAAAWKEGLPTLDAIADRKSVTTLTPEVSAQHSLDTGNPFNTQDEFHTFFSTVAPNYAIPLITDAHRQADPTFVSVITASETMLPSLVMLGAYICNGPSRHTFPDPDVTNQEACPLCPSAAHAVVTLVLP